MQVETEDLGDEVSLPSSDTDGTCDLGQSTYTLRLQKAREVLKICGLSGHKGPRQDLL